MKPVRFTDLERYRVPYVHSSRTDIRLTFARRERELVAQKNRRRAPGHRGAVTEENAR
jgi:hypothetical protein